MGCSLAMQMLREMLMILPGERDSEHANVFRRRVCIIPDNTWPNVRTAAATLQIAQSMRTQNNFHFQYSSGSRETTYFAKEE